MKKYFILFIITIYAAIFRFYGLDYDLPYVFSYDETYLMDKSVEVADGNLRHGIIIRGSLPYYVNGLVIKLAMMLNPSILNGQETVTSVYKLDKTPFYTIGRAVSATYGTLEIIILFFLGKILFGTKVGLLASFFTSISSLAIHYSHQVAPDTALSATILLTLYLSIFAYKKQKLRLFLLSAIFIGISAAQKLPGVLVLLPVVFLLIFSKCFKHLPNKNKLLYLAMFGLIIPLVYFLSYPFIFSNLNQFSEEWVYENSRENRFGLIRDIGIYGRVIKYLFQWLHFGTGTFILLFGFLGIILLGIRKNLIGIILAFFLLTYLMGISLPVPYFDRWVMPLIPLISLFAAVPLCGLFIKLRQKPFNLTLKFLLIFLVSISPLVRSAVISSSFRLIDTRILASEWLKKQNIDEDMVLYDRGTTEFTKKRKALKDMGIEELSNYAYFITSNTHLVMSLAQEDIFPELANKYRFIKHNFPEVAKFFPPKISIHIDDLTLISSINKMGDRKNKGPLIIIFKLLIRSNNIPYLL